MTFARRLMRNVLLSSVIIRAAVSIVMIESAVAETQFFTSVGSAAEAAWTTCPVVAQFDGQICNYTATYAAGATNFQPFIVIQMAVLRLFRNGAVELADIATGYMQPASVANFQFQLGELRRLAPRDSTAAAEIPTIFLLASCWVSVRSPLVGLHQPRQRLGTR